MFPSDSFVVSFLLLKLKSSFLTISIILYIYYSAHSVVSSLLLSVKSRFLTPAGLVPVYQTMGEQTASRCRRKVVAIHCSLVGLVVNYSLKDVTGLNVQHRCRGAIDDSRCCVKRCVIDGARFGVA